MGITILVVDDHPINLKLASQVLQSSGHEVMEAKDAEQAQELLQERIPDLVLTDVTLPGIDGLELTRRLKTNPRYQHLPVVALTASAMKGDETRVLEAGCDAYIAKPFDTRNLAVVLVEVLARHTDKLK